MTTPFIEGVEFLGVTVLFNSPVDRSLYDFGAVRLECEGRNFVLDVTRSVTSDERDQIDLFLEVDTDTFPIGEENKYDLTVFDLKDGMNATLFIGNEWEEKPESMTLFVLSEGMKRMKGMTMTIAIDLKIEN